MTTLSEIPPFLPRPSTPSLSTYAGAALLWAIAAGALPAGVLAQTEPAPSESQGARGGRPPGEPPNLLVDGFLHVAAGGEAEVESDGGSFEGDVDATVGLGGRAHYMLLDYLGLGGMLRFAFVRPDLGDGRQTNIDLDASVLGQVAFDVGSLVLDVYGTFPIGLTISILNDDLNPVSDDRNTGVGVNLGLAVGTRAWFIPNTLAGFVELGFLWRRANHSEDVLGQEVDVSITLTQFLLQFGVTFGTPA
jgi:hypothetical protein